MNTILTTFLSITIFGLTFAAPPKNQLKTNGLLQTHANSDISTTSRVKIPGLIPSITIRLPESCGAGGPCDLRDEKCMSNLMLKYVNDYRKSKGISKMLSTCSSSQLNNAVSHSKKMEKKGAIYHQKIEDVNLGCSSFFSGENVAKNHCSYDKTKTDPARLCVDQFIGSPSHRKNLLSETHESVAMGVIISPEAYIFCTQTFSQSTKYSNSGICAPIGSTRYSPPAEDEPEPLSSDESKRNGERAAADEDESEPQPLNPVKQKRRADPEPCDSFKTKEFRAMIKGSREGAKNFKATEKNGECVYCTSDDLCLDHEYSKTIDDEISRR